MWIISVTLLSLDSSGMKDGISGGGKEEGFVVIIGGGNQGRACKDEFWTPQRERALTTALIGYAGVYGNVEDVIDEISYALQKLRKEVTDLGCAAISALVRKRIGQRALEGDTEVN